MHPEHVTVVVPTYNERENISSLAPAVLDQGFRLLIVDDGSPDGTGDLADALADGEERMTVLHRSHKQGLGPAYAHGFKVAIDAGADVVCEMDADFSHDPRDLPRLVEAIENGADLAIGSRYVPGGATPDWPPHRRFLSRGGNLYARLALGLGVRDSTAGFRAYRSECAAQLDAASCSASGYGFQVEMTMRAVDAEFRVDEVPVTFRDRQYGTSKMSGSIVVEAMWLVTQWGVKRRLRQLRSAK